MKPQFIYTGIRVRDLEESIRFYRDSLGMTLRGSGKNRAIHGEWAQLECPRTHQLLELNWYSPRSPFYRRWTPGVELDHLCFRVPNVDEALERLERSGGKRIGGPYLTAGWKMIDVQDPNGICIEIGSASPRSRARRGQRMR